MPQLRGSRHLPRLVSGALLAVVTTGCAEIGTSRTATIGFAYSMDGAIVARLAEAAARARWPDGPRLEVRFEPKEDGLPDHLEIPRAERLLAGERVVAVVGHGGSRGSLAVAPLYNAARVPQVVPVGTSRLLDHSGEWTFALAPSDSIEGLFMAAFAKHRLGARTATIVFTNDEYGAGLRNALVAAAAERDVEIVDAVLCDPATDFETLVAASLRRGRPDVVFAAARPAEVGQLARALGALAPGTPIVAGDGALPAGQLEATAGTSPAPVYVATFWLPDAADSASQAFVSAFREAAGRDPDATHAMAFDALMATAAAIHEVGPDPARVREYLGALGVERPPYPGITGPVSFVPRRRGPLIMTRITGGAPRRVGDAS